MVQNEGETGFEDCAHGVVDVPLDALDTTTASEATERRTGLVCFLPGFWIEDRRGIPKVRFRCAMMFVSIA